MSKSYLHKRSKQEFMQVNIILLSEKETGAGGVYKNRDTY